MSNPEDGINKSIKEMQLSSMKASLEARNKTQDSLLEQIGTIFDEIDTLIPKLPPMFGAEINELERHAQESIKEKVSVFRNLTQLFLYENVETDGDEGKARAAEALGASRYETIKALINGNKMTAQESLDWYNEEAERGARFAEFIVRWAAIMDAHAEQIYRS